MIYKYCLTIISFVFFISCSTQKKIEDLSGKYMSKKYSMISKIGMAMKSESHVLNSELMLNQDSSYIHTTCGNIVKGKWNIRNDSLFLFCEENRYRNDSLNQIKALSCGSKPAVYIVVYGKTIELKQTFSSKNKRIVNNLIKVN